MMLAPCIRTQLLCMCMDYYEAHNEFFKFIYFFLYDYFKLSLLLINFLFKYS